jgi:hypothetical protein
MGRADRSSTVRCSRDAVVDPSVVRFTANHLPSGAAPDAATVTRI